MRTTSMLASLLICLAGGVPGEAAAYDPLSSSKPGGGQTLDLVVNDKTRGREIPVKIYLPAARVPAPVVLFSHGLGGTREGSAYLGQHWSARGYVAVFLQHPGSDDSVWKDQPAGKRRAEMEQAASPRNFLLRVPDVPTVLNQFERWGHDDNHPLAGRLDLTRVGMAGHSFGAVTTQAVSGQSFGSAGQRFTDRRIKAAIAFSPSSPRQGTPQEAFGRVRVPWMLVTGTKDTAPIAGQTVESRRDVYPHLPASIDKYELVLHNAEHSAFTDRPLPGDTEGRNPNHHRAVLALTTAFWDAHLQASQAAQGWLHGPGASAVLEQADRWQFHRGERTERD